MGSDESGKLHRHGAQVGEGPGHLCRHGVQPHPAALSGVPGQLRGIAGVYSRGFDRFEIKMFSGMVEENCSGLDWNIYFKPS